jgi:hypothetical protein
MVALEGTAELPDNDGGKGKAQCAEPTLSRARPKPDTTGAGRTGSRGCEGNHYRFFFGHCCDRPGCYEGFVAEPRSPHQRFCSRACRQAMERVWRRERRWRHAAQRPLKI